MSQPASNRLQTDRRRLPSVNKYTRPGLKRVRELLTSNAFQSPLQPVAAPHRPRTKRLSSLIGLFRCVVLFFVPLFFLSSSVFHLCRPASSDRSTAGHSRASALGRDSSRVFIPFAAASRYESVRGERSRPGISLVAACRSNVSVLSSSVPFWLGLRKQNVVDEVVLVDWSSELEPGETVLSALDSLGGSADSIRVIRVANEQSWCAARAYNLGAALSVYDAVVLVDCGFSGPNQLPDFDSFSSMEVAASFGVAGDEKLLELYTAARRSAFEAVGGYDDRQCGDMITGRPDADLSSRLKAVGFEVGHDILDSSLRFPSSAPVHCRVEFEFKRFQERKFPHLLRSHTTNVGRKEARFRIESTGSMTLEGSRPVQVPSVLSVVSSSCNFSQLVSHEQWTALWGKSLELDLRNRFSVPRELVGGMDLAARERLWRHLLARRLRKRDELLESHAGLGEEPELLDDVSKNSPELFVVHVMHGLGNRIRALSSAMAFAEATDRELVVVWEKDQHCKADFDELFESSLDGVGGNEQLHVINQFPLRWDTLRAGLHVDSVWARWRLYNYMHMEGIGAVKNALIENRRGAHIYFKSAYVINPSAQVKVGWDQDVEQLRRLRPIPRIQKVVHEKLGLFNLDMTVGVHIRSLGLADEAGIDAVREYGKNDSEVLSFWRAQTRSEAFFEQMRILVIDNPTVRFFLASDSMDVIRETSERFPSRTISLKDHPCDNRSAECLQLALADMMILGRTALLLGSPWSSFTEAASRFGCKRVRMAGLDFSVPSAEEEALLSPAVQDMLARVRKKRARRKS